MFTVAVILTFVVSKLGTNEDDSQTARSMRMYLQYHLNPRMRYCLT